MIYRGRPRDYFGHLIEVGDDYFYGHPTQVGRVVAVKIKSITIEYICSYKGSKTTMNCKSPNKGICLNKIADMDGAYY